MSIDFEHFEGKPLAAGQLSALREPGVFSESDGDLPDSELFVIWFKRLRERRMLDEFRAEIMRRALAASVPPTGTK